MRSRSISVAVAVALASRALLAQETTFTAEIRAAIAAAVEERVGPMSNVQVELVAAPAAAKEGGPLVAKPAAGARIGQPARFSINGAGMAQPFSVVARVNITAPHVVATHAIAADTTIEATDVELRDAPLRGVAVERLPKLDDALAVRTRRAIAAGEVLTRAALLRPYAVRAGDTVVMTIRRGLIEVRGVGRAVSSGYVGDVIRVLPPSSRQPNRARVIAPASVEVLQ